MVEPIDRRRDDEGFRENNTPRTKRFGVLLSAIEAPTAALSGPPSSAQVAVLDLNPSDVSRFPQLQFNGEITDVCNYDPSLSGGTPAIIEEDVITNPTAATFVMFDCIDGVNVFTWVGGFCP